MRDIVSPAVMFYVFLQDTGTHVSTEVTYQLDLMPSHQSAAENRLRPLDEKGPNMSHKEEGTMSTNGFCHSS